MSIKKYVYKTADIDYLISNYIREYDISKANINVLYSKGVLSAEQYEQFFNMDKYQREVTIGLLQRDNPEASRILKQGISEYRNRFFEENNIKENEILSIKNDAVFLINKIPSVTKFDNIEFAHKNTYTSFYKLGDRNHPLEVYYYYNMINNEECIDIKGINDEKIKLHDKYFLDFLKVCFCSAQIDSIENTIDLLSNFYNQYVNLSLDIGYYRELNSESLYSTIIPSIYTYKSQNLSDNHKHYVNIMCNLNILRQLTHYYSSIHFSK